MLRLRKKHITPRVAQNTTNWSSAIDRRTTGHAGYTLRQQKRKRVEQSFAWMKIVTMLRKVKWRGREKVGWLFTLTAATYNLTRLQRLQARTITRTWAGKPFRKGSERPTVGRDNPPELTD